MDLEVFNLQNKSEEATRKKEIEFRKLKDKHDRNMRETKQSYKNDCEAKRKEIKNKRLNRWFKKKEVHTLLMKDMFKGILDVVEELHVTCKAGITKPRWRELTRRFKNNEQIYTSQQVIIESEPEEESEEEIDMTENNEDYVEFQNYLSVVGKWNPKNIEGRKNIKVQEITNNENIDVPSFLDYVNNNRIIGKAVSEITCLIHQEETEKVVNDQIDTIQKQNSNIPSYMPLKLFLFGDQYEYSDEVTAKVAEEYNLKIFNVKEISEEIDKLLNPPEEEPQDQKKGKGKQVQEEAPEDEEELKELNQVAERITIYREDNPGILSMTEDQIVEVLAIKIKYSFEVKNDEEALHKIKEGIKNEFFKEPEDEGDGKKAKGKGTSKEELEEELLKYKQVQPSGYLIINAPKTEEMMLEYEKMFNGYISTEERVKTDYETDRDKTNKLFPCSLSEQKPYLLEPNANFILNRSLTLTKDIISEEVNENEVILIEKNSPSELQKR